MAGSRIYPIRYGYDSTFPQNSNANPRAGAPRNANVLAMHRWLIEHTNISHAGGYIIKSGSWATAFEDVWTLGLGLTFFDNVGIQTGGGGARSKADGESEAAALVDRSHGPNGAIKQFNRAVVYRDNEDNSAAGMQNLADYYRGLYYWLEKQAPDKVRIRPGLYAKLWIAGVVLAEFPYLYLCDVQYPRGALLPGKKGDWDDDSNPGNPFNVTFDPVSTDKTPAGLRFKPSVKTALPASNSVNAIWGIMRPASTARRGPRRPWRAWPAIYQFEGTNQAKPADTAQTVSVNGYSTTFSFNAGIKNWIVDYESSLVDDPAYPSASPRLAAFSGSVCCIARLDRQDPPPNEKRQGRCQAAFYASASDSFAPFAQPASASANTGIPIAPGVAPGWLQSSVGPILVVPRRNGFDLRLETTLVLPSATNSVSPSIAVSPNGRRIPVHSPWTVANVALDDAHLFAVADDGSLLTSRAKPLDQSWPELRVHAPDLRVHQYSQLVAIARGIRGQDGGITAGYSVDAFYIGSDLRLQTAWWNKTLPWPSNQHLAIGDPEIYLPTTNIAAVSPDADSLLVFGTGFDLRLNFAIWSSGSGWIGPCPLGGEDELLAAHGQVSAVFNPVTSRCEVLVTANDLSLLLYQLDRSQGTWANVNGSPLNLFQPDYSSVIADSAINPFGDNVIVLTRRRIVAAVFSESGATVAKWRSSDASRLADEAGIWSDWKIL